MLSSYSWSSSLTVIISYSCRICLPKKLQTSCPPANVKNKSHHHVKPNLDILGGVMVVLEFGQLYNLSAENYSYLSGHSPHSFRVMCNSWPEGIWDGVEIFQRVTLLIAEMLHHMSLKLLLANILWEDNFTHRA